MKPRLHYIHDPLCGWCYAAEKLTDAVSARSQGQFDILLHAGGLFPRIRLPDAKRAHIRLADARIADMTGQKFGAAYLHGLLSDPEVVYDSSVPIRGILAAEKGRTGSSLAMLKTLQHAHYLDGLRIANPATIIDLAGKAGLEKQAFIAAFDSLTESELQEHLDSTRRLMNEVGAHGFPSFVAQIGSHLKVLPHEHFYGTPDAFADMVGNLLTS